MAAWHAKVVGGSWKKFLETCHFEPRVSSSWMQTSRAIDTIYIETWNGKTHQDLVCSFGLHLILTFFSRTRAHWQHAIWRCESVSLAKTERPCSKDWKAMRFRHDEYREKMGVTEQDSKCRIKHWCWHHIHKHADKRRKIYSETIKHYPKVALVCVKPWGGQKNISFAGVDWYTLLSTGVSRAVKRGRARQYLG